MLGPMRWLARGEVHLPADADFLGPFEAAWAARMRYAKRYQEFLVNRWTAKAAVVKALGLGAVSGPDAVATLRRVEIRNHLDAQRRGAPYLLIDGAEAADVEVSLTDRAGWAVCLVGEGLGLLGVDLEVVEPRSPGFLRDFLTEPERDLVCAQPAGEPQHLAANLVWSSKESALKVLRTGLRRDTRSVRVEVGDAAQLAAAGSGDPDALGCWSPLRVHSVEGETFDGWWARHGQFVLSVLSRGVAPLPESLETPPALASAAPVHSWLMAPLRD